MVLVGAEVPFANPREGQRFEFPRDHGSHPEFKIEWWYVTGHLFEEGHDRRFGFQATFFRRSAPRRPAVDGVYAGSERFGTDQLYLAHFAIADLKRGRFYHRERLNRDGWNANASTNGLDVFNGTWRLRMEEEKTQTLRLTGDAGSEHRLELSLVPKKPLVIFGTNGVSRKGKDAEAASHYLTFPRLLARGNLIEGGRAIAVSGEAWMDHEISSSQLGREQTGWDWTCIQFENGCELMAYRLRGENGQTDEASTLAWIDKEGRVTHLGAGEFEWRSTARWRSPATRIEYPNEVLLTFKPPGESSLVRVRVKPLMQDQEIRGGASGLAYWEGACEASLTRADGALLRGSAYLELAGYGRDLRRQLR